MRFRGMAALVACAALGLGALGIGLAAPVAQAAAPAPQGQPIGTSQWSGPSGCGAYGSVQAPANAAYVDVTLAGGSGGSGGAASSGQGYGGRGAPGGFVTAEFAIQGGAVVGAVVGCQGQSAPQGNGVVGTGGAGGAGWTSGGAGGYGYYCSGICGHDIYEGSDGSGGGGGGSTAVCLGVCPFDALSGASVVFLNSHPSPNLLAVAGGGGGGGETMCSGTYGGVGGEPATGAYAYDLAQVGSGPGGGSGGSGQTGGDAGGAGGINSINLAPLAEGALGAGGNGGSGSRANFGDSAGSGGGGAGLVGGFGAPAGTTDCGAGGGGGAGSSWANGSAVSAHFGVQGQIGTGGILVTFLEAAPPTATIASPANSGTYAVGQVVTTSFSCAEGQGGSGLASCTDSNGASGGVGRLNTAAPGQHTYTVRAVSNDGQTGVATISYQVFAPPTADISTPGTGGTYVVGQVVPTQFACGDSNAAPLSTCQDSNGVSAQTVVSGGLAGTGALDTSHPGSFTYTVTAKTADGQQAVASIDYRVVQAQTATTLASTGSPSVVGEPVTYTATVAPVAPGAGHPTGTVTFSDNGTVICDAVDLGTAGTAGCTQTYAAPGTHQVTASYSGDSDFVQSAGSLTQQVAQARTVTALAAAPNPAVFGAQVTFTAAVAPVAPGSGTPTGSVTFTDGTVALGTVALGSEGTASLQTSRLPAGPQTITATYSGDSNFLGSAGSLTQQISYAFHLTAPTAGTSVVQLHRTLPLSFLLTDAAGNPVTGAVATLEVNGQLATAGVGYSRGSDSFVYSGGAYRYLLQVTSAEVVDGHMLLTIRLSDGTTHTVDLTVD